MNIRSRPDKRDDRTEWLIAVLRCRAEVISVCITGNLARFAELP